jgi:hypothetical protein
MDDFEFTGPEPWFIIGALGFAAVLEHFGRKRFGPRLAALLGLPLPNVVHSIETNPATLPDDWFPGFEPLGNETWLIQDNVNHWCFGILRVERSNGELVLTVQRRVPIGWVASIAAMFSIAPYVLGDGRTEMYVTAVVYSVVWSFQIWRSYRWLGELVVDVGERVKGLEKLRS